MPEFSIGDGITKAVRSVTVLSSEASFTRDGNLRANASIANVAKMMKINAIITTMAYNNAKQLEQTKQQLVVRIDWTSSQEQWNGLKMYRCIADSAVLSYGTVSLVDVRRNRQVRDKDLPLFLFLRAGLD